MSWRTPRWPLSKDGTISGVAQIGDRLIALALGITLARTLGDAGYGTYAWALAWLGVALVFAGAGMPTLVMREAAAALTQQRWPHLRGVLLAGPGIVLGMSSMMAITGSTLLLTLYTGPPERLAALLLACALLPITALIQVLAAALRGLHQQTRAQVAELLLRPMTSFSLILAVFAISPTLRSAKTALVLQAVAAFIVVVLLAIWLRRATPEATRRVKAVYEGRRWKASALPFIVMGGAAAINSYADLVMLGLFRPLGDVGVYRVAVQGAAITIMGLHAANTVLAPRFASLHAAGSRSALQRLVTKGSRWIFASAAPLALLFIGAGGPLAAFVFGPEFARAHTALAILCVGQLASASLGPVGFLLMMTGHERITARTMIFTTIINVLLNAALIPTMGINGAAVATSVSLTSWYGTLAIVANNRLQVQTGVWKWR